MITGSSKTCLITISLAVLIAAWFGCMSTPSEPEFDNPLIPGDPHFEPPMVSLIDAPAEGATVDTSYVRLAWEGNHDVMDFSYRMDDKEWSAWTSIREVVYQHLDEWRRTFQLRCRYAPEIEGDDITSLSFIVDDIQGPALWFYPRYQEASVGGGCLVEVMLEEVTDVMAVKVMLEYDPARLQIRRIDVFQDGTSLLRTNGGTVVSFTEYDNTAGSASIDAGTAAGEPPGVSGSGKVARVKFKVTAAGTSYISFTGSSMLRNPNNIGIPIAEMAGAIVKVR